ncbi:MAG: rhomboid family intramembrane serine protease [Alphaproteobacteria bacterium]
MLNLSPGFDPKSAKQPIFNIPKVIAVIVGLILAVHALRVLVLSDGANLQVILRFAFFPIRVLDPDAVQAFLPTGAARVWTFVSYGLLHADWSHAIFNSLWLAAFGAPLAWRFGTGRFLVFLVAGCVAGAAVHMLVYPAGAVPLVGASAAISACMAAASRFVFTSGGPGWRQVGPEVYRRPAERLQAVIRNTRVLAFLGIWFAINLLIGLTSVANSFASGAIAWEAHIGGFLVGLFLFPIFDPVRRSSR